MQKISTCLWFNDNAEDAVKFYTSLFENSRTTAVTHYDQPSAEVSGRPEGSVLTVVFQLDGQEFMALNGGPIYSLSPAISFFVACNSEQEIERLFQQLSNGGEILMPLDKYPFSEKFGWVSDRFGLSWQLILSTRTQKITPFLTFVGEQFGKAEEAINFYVSLFKNSRAINIERYRAGEPGQEGTVKHGTFSLDGQEFMAMDGLGDHAFTFTPGTSLIAYCNTQDEVDELWKNITSDGGQVVECGWATDKFGVSWQIVPTVLGEMLQDKDSRKTTRVMEALLKMKKLDIKELELAYRS